MAAGARAALAPLLHLISDSFTRVGNSFSLRSPPNATVFTGSHGARPSPGLHRRRRPRVVRIAELVAGLGGDQVRVLLLGAVVPRRLPQRCPRVPGARRADARGRRIRAAGTA